MRDRIITTITRYVTDSSPTLSPEARADALLLRLGAQTIAHPGGTLHEHLRRVHTLLETWGAPRPVRLAGLCHAVYGTAGFDHELLAQTERELVVDAIGRRAEALVHLYARCDRADFYHRIGHERPPTFRDRLTGREHTLSETSARALMEITAANELDVVTHDEVVRSRHKAGLVRLFAASADLLSPPARKAWGVRERREARATFSVDRIDHVVLTVANIPRSVRFYERALGMRAVTFGAGRRALEFGESKINLHQAGGEIRPHAAQPVPGSADLCLVTESSMEDVIDQLTAWGVRIEQGPVRRTGATGPVLSCYVRDPDGNLVEVSTYALSRPSKGHDGATAGATAS